MTVKTLMRGIHELQIQQPKTQICSLYCGVLQLLQLELQL